MTIDLIPMPALLNHAEPSPCDLRKSAVEDVALSIAKQLDFSPGGELEPIVKKLGGRIEFLAWEDWLTHSHDTITIDGPRDFTIRLMWSDGPLRHRFTIAHELGHYFLHSRQGKVRMIAGRDGTNRRVEWEANWFAAAFLMPEVAFRTAAENYGRDPLRLAGQFLVSVEAATVRLQTLGLAV